MDNAAIEANIEKLEKVLSSFNVTAKVVEVHIGPTVAQYELEIASGTRVNKITTLSREIALALSKKDVRIEAPIPGKSTVGVEFANEKLTAVSFYEIMASKIMQQNNYQHEILSTEHHFSSTKPDKTPPTESHLAPVTEARVLTLPVRRR